MLNLWEVITSRQRVFTEDLLQNTLYRKMRGESGGGGEYDVTITTTPPLYLPYSLGYNLSDWSITGNTVQDGEPTPENPVDVQGVGDWDETTQKFKIPVVTRGTDGAENTTNIYLDSPLMTDETVSSDGSREVEWGVKVFDGSEDITKHPTSDFMIYKLNNIKQTQSAREVATAFCTHLVCYNYYTIYNVVQRGFAVRYAGLSEGLIISYQYSGQTLTEYKQYLTDQYNNGTPVTVYYQLATPTTSTIAPPNIPTATGTCVLDVDTSVQPSSVTVTYKSSVPDNDMADMIQLLSEI